ncbi:cytochrome P450 2G1-like [Alligator sinensis]|uniref:Cytochrome P450 2G1-like n=1 Tax=Alligator sinensis TaxID=38654 RepID=A0A3Q0H9V4_ALLSI|nr:cytochrome P450 2G1-like [Alligator sinensis]
MALRNFGMGKKSIEERIQEESQYLVEEMGKTKGSPFDPTLAVTHSIANIICSIVFGNRFDYKGQKFLNLIGSINNLFLDMSSISTVLWTLTKDKVQEEIDRVIGRTHSPAMNDRGRMPYTNAVIHEIQRLANILPFGVPHKVTCDTHFQGYLLPKVLPHKVQEEIDRVIGRTHSPAMNDRGRMPYTNAVIHEIQRLANILPFGVPHKVTCDTHFQGYLLPKDTDVCTVLGTVLQDHKYFKDPESFHPEHFLDEESHFKKNDSFLPFGTGKRGCLGKSLALVELFLMLTTILQRFTLKSPIPAQEIDLAPRANGLGIVPPSYELYALPQEEGLHDSVSEMAVL